MGMYERIMEAAKKYDQTESEILEAMGRAYALKEAKKQERVNESWQMDAETQFEVISDMGFKCVKRR